MLTFFKTFSNIFIFIAYGMKFTKELNFKNLIEKDKKSKTIKKTRLAKRHESPFVTNSNFVFPSLDLLENQKKTPYLKLIIKKALK